MADRTARRHPDPGGPIPIEHDTALLLRAARFAADRHRAQRRKDADASPYINHPLAVAETLAASGVTDATVLAAALLHDTVEDTATTPAELAAAFGDAIAGIVREVTDDKSLPKAERKARQVADAPRRSPGGKLVTLADKTCNLEDLVARPPAGWDSARRREYVAWSARVVAGCRGTSAALEARYDAVHREAIAMHGADA